MPNPFTNAQTAAEDVANNGGVWEGRVTRVPNYDGNSNGNKHIVWVEPDGGGDDEAVICTVGANGDVRIPSVSDKVAVVESDAGLNYLHGIIYTAENSAPTYERGERRISHNDTDAEIIFETDGTVRIQSSSSGDVYIDGVKQ